MVFFTYAHWLVLQAQPAWNKSIIWPSETSMCCCLSWRAQARMASRVNRVNLIPTASAWHCPKHQQNVHKSRQNHLPKTRSMLKHENQRRPHLFMVTPGHLLAQLLPVACRGDGFARSQSVSVVGLLGSRQAGSLNLAPGCTLISVNRFRSFARSGRNTTKQPTAQTLVSPL